MQNRLNIRVRREHYNVLYECKQLELGFRLGYFAQHMVHTFSRRSFVSRCAKSVRSFVSRCAKSVHSMRVQN